MMSSTELSPTELALLDRPQAILPDPEPHTKRAQQVRRLEQHGLYKTADAVKVCGRRGEKWGYGCGRSFLRKIIRAHRRFCCLQCDKHVAGRLFQEHRAYRERLHPSGTLHRVTVRSGHYPLSSDSIREFENAVVEAARGWFKGQFEADKVWGFKSMTHYESGLVIKGIIYLPPGASLSPEGLQVPFGTCTVGIGVSVSAFEAMLADILGPTLTEDHSVLRADLMAAFNGGNHLRSLGVFYGQITKRLKEDHLERDQNLPLIREVVESGVAFGGPQQKLYLSSGEIRHRRVFGGRQYPSAPYVPPCPHCGPGCERISVSIEPMSELQDIPSLEENTSTRTAWREMQLLLRRRYVF